MSLTFALVGNQNCGKSTLFNYLTGSNQHVGNFPGVTVQKKEGRLLNNKDVTVIDLPGIYSLSPYTSEEIVTRDLLLRSKPDIIINVIDATNIERSLYLSLQLIELNTPMIMALNMIDELTASGGSINIKKIEDRLTVPVVPITANSGAGVDELLSRALMLAENRLKERDRQISELKRENAQNTLRLGLQAPKIRYFDEVLRSSSTYTPTQIAKELGMSGRELNLRLKALGIQFRQSGTWLLAARYQNEGYTRTHTHRWQNRSGETGTAMHTVWTEKGRLFIHCLFSHLPVF